MTRAISQEVGAKVCNLKYRCEKSITREGTFTDNKFRIGGKPNENLCKLYFDARTNKLPLLVFIKNALGRTQLRNFISEFKNSVRIISQRTNARTPPSSGIIVRLDYARLIIAGYKLCIVETGTSERPKGYELSVDDISQRITRIIPKQHAGWGSNRGSINWLCEWTRLRKIESSARVARAWRGISMSKGIVRLTRK